MLFQYVSIGVDGRRRSGQIEAIGPDEARRQIVAEGSRVVSISETTKRHWFEFESRRDMPMETVSAFALELAGLLRAGAPLRQALEIQADGRGGPPALAKEVLRSIENGGSIAAALKSRGGASALLGEFAAAGESGAGLDHLLERGGAFLGARAEALAKIRSAFAYPLFIVALSVIAVLAIVFFVAPALAPILEGSDGAGLIIWMGAAGTWVSERSTMILLALAGVIACLFLIFRQPAIRSAWIRFLWSLPIVGTIGRDLSSGEACEVLAALIETGRPVESATRFAAGISGATLEKPLIRVAERMRDGETASSAFVSETALPNDIRRLAHLGERTSGFAQAMRQGGRICHTRAMRRLDKLAAVAGPALVIGMGLMIALLMLTVLNSLTSLGGSIA